MAELAEEGTLAKQRALCLSVVTALRTEDLGDTPTVAILAPDVVDISRLSPGQAGQHRVIRGQPSAYREGGSDRVAQHVIRHCCSARAGGVPARAGHPEYLAKDRPPRAEVG